MKMKLQGGRNKQFSIQYMTENSIYFWLFKFFSAHRSLLRTQGPLEQLVKFDLDNVTEAHLFRVIDDEFIIEKSKRAIDSLTLSWFANGDSCPVSEISVHALVRDPLTHSKDALFAIWEGKSDILGLSQRLHVTQCYFTHEHVAPVARGSP